MSVLKENSDNIKKNFIYFGRINSHKNLEEFIKAFIKVSPNNSWSFHIYGIDDDINYKKKLIKLINDSNAGNYIKFFKPEFDKKRKFKIISESWCNVLTSKSEILSLSVLEAFGVGTPSLVNKKITFPNWIEKFLIKSSIETSTLADNIRLIMNQDLNNRLLKKTKWKKNLRNNTVVKKLL